QAGLAVRHAHRSIVDLWPRQAQPREPVLAGDALFLGHQAQPGEDVGGDACGGQAWVVGGAVHAMSAILSGLTPLSMPPMPSTRAGHAVETVARGRRRVRAGEDATDVEDDVVDARRLLTARRLRPGAGSHRAARCRCRLPEGPAAAVAGCETR